MDKQTQSRAPLIVAIVLLLPPVLYVGSYYALVVPAGIKFQERDDWGHEITAKRIYRLSGDRVEQFYKPIYLRDRKLRPRAWELQPHEPN